MKSVIIAVLVFIILTLLGMRGISTAGESLSKFMEKIPKVQVIVTKP